MMEWLKKINWEVRFKNIVFICDILAAVAVPVLAYFGLTGADLTSWSVVWSTIVQAVSNPYVCFLMVVAAWNAIHDPTTKGVGDSAQALTYTSPNK